jgi:hypothetical protein
LHFFFWNLLVGLAHQNASASIYLFFAENE